MAKAIHPYNVLVRPLITEKGTMLAESGKYAFEVASAANKIQIKEAVELAFSVSVTKVNVMNMPGKKRRVGKSQGMTSEWKKAVVTLAPGERIEFFQGV